MSGILVMGMSLFFLHNRLHRNDTFLSSICIICYKKALPLPTKINNK